MKVGLAVAEDQEIIRRSVSSSVWVFGRKIFANLIRLGAVAILARHLDPADFGLVALAQVLLQFTLLAQETGVGTYVICDRASGWEQRTHSAFWLNMAITAAQMLLFAAAMPVIAYFYPNPLLRSILPFLAAAFFLGQLAGIPEALLKRRLQYHSLAICDTLGDFTSAALSVILAIGGWGIWSLVIPQIILQPVRSFAIFAIARWRPHARFGLRDWPGMFRYSAHLIASYLFQLVANDGDTLLVGKMLGGQSLGYYNVAWQTSNLVGRNITSVVSNVSLPVLSMLSGHEARLAIAYQRMLRLLATLSFPILIGMFAVADDLVLLVYGPRWHPVATLLRLFIVFTLARSVTSPTGTIFCVVGKPEISSKFTGAFLPFYLGAIYVGSRWGLVGVAVGVMLVRTLGALTALALSTRLVHLSFWAVINAMLPVALLAAFMGGTVWGLRMVLVSWSVQVVVRVIVCLGFGALIYGLGLALFGREAYGEVRRLVSVLIPSRTGRGRKTGPQPLLTATGEPR